MLSDAGSREPNVVIDIMHLKNLARIEEQADAIRIGAGVPPGRSDGLA